MFSSEVCLPEWNAHKSSMTRDCYETVQGIVCPTAAKFTHCLVDGSSETMVKAQVIRMSSFLIVSPLSGTLATCSEISILLLPVAYVTCPESSRSQSSLREWLMVIRSTAAVTVVTDSPVCLYAITPDKASRSINMLPSLRAYQVARPQRENSSYRMCPLAFK